VYVPKEDVMNCIRINATTVPRILSVRLFGLLCAMAATLLAYQAPTAAQAASGWVMRAVVPMPWDSPNLVAGPDGLIYVIGGYTEIGPPSNAVTAVEAFNPATGTWATKAPLSAGHYDGGAGLGSDNQSRDEPTQHLQRHDRHGLFGCIHRRSRDRPPGPASIMRIRAAWRRTVGVERANAQMPSLDPVVGKCRMWQITGRRHAGKA
jgi:hypothetical protein